MLLEGKTAIVYGAAGSIGAAVSAAYAREGARLFLAGRTTETLDRVADQIRANGGHADVAQVDATNRSLVQAHANTVAAATGAIDIAFNATSNDDLQSIALVDMDYDDFIRPVDKVIATQFAIATAVARHMMPRGAGVILAMGGGREAIPRLGGAHVAWTALAGLCRQLACELGPHGVRVAWLLSPGSPQSDTEVDDLAGGTMLHRRPSLTDVANVATFLASNWASTMTATEVNLTSGAVVD
ncbi:MAG TPA: SDR family oxidoreductase [Jatrophihabitantaceae bacterium]|nr:SDR family oxidoreductase [Jatrophihabitantaceae bacterium]